MQLVSDRLTPPAADAFSSRALSPRLTPLSPLNPHRLATNWSTPPFAMDEDAAMAHSQASHQTSSPSPPRSSPTPFGFNAVAGPSRLAYAAQPMTPVPLSSHAKALRRRQTSGDDNGAIHNSTSFASKRSQAVPPFPRSTSHDPSLRLQSARPLQKWRRPHSLESDVYSRKLGSLAPDTPTDSVQDALWNHKLSQRVHRQGDRARLRRRASDGMDEGLDDQTDVDAEDEELFSHLIAMQRRKAQRHALAALERDMDMSDPAIIEAAIREAEGAGAGDTASPEEEEMLRMLAAEEEEMGMGVNPAQVELDGIDGVDPAAIFDVDDDIDMQ